MPKRIRFLISSAILTLGFVGMQFLDNQLRFVAIAFLTILTSIFSFWSFYEGLGKNMTLLSLVLPTMFTLGVGVFWFLLPVNIFTRIPSVLFYAVGIYVLLSTMNIYTVSASKTIALLRAARGVGFVMTLVVGFLLYDAVISVRGGLLWLVPLIFTISFLLFYQGFWSIDLESKFDRKILVMSFVSSLIIAELSLILFFWPVTVVVGSLFLTSGLYLLLGLGQAKLEDRLFPTVVREYLTVGFLVLIGMFFATRWGG